MKQKNLENKCYYRWAPSLGGGFAGTPEETWGVKKYDPEKHINEYCVFCGIYGLSDFYALWRHKGKKYCWWAGSDILHFKNGYWLDEDGKTRIEPRPLARWINNNCDNWCENEREQAILKSCGIEAKVCPSFLGDVNKFKISFKPGNKLYASVSGDNFNMYGWYEIEQLAPKYSQIEFHLYGNEEKWETENKNVIVHGRVPKEQMNTEIKEMQGGLRLLNFDGFSEILAKSILWGQWPVSLIKYPHILSLDELGMIVNKKEPNIEGREYFLQTLNKYPWNNKI